MIDTHHKDRQEKWVLREKIACQYSHNAYYRMNLSRKFQAVSAQKIIIWVKSLTIIV